MTPDEVNLLCQCDCRCLHTGYQRGNMFTQDLRTSCFRTQARYISPWIASLSRISRGTLEGSISQISSRSACRIGKIGGHGSIATTGGVGFTRSDGSTVVELLEHPPI